MLVVACSSSTPKLSGPARAYAEAEERNVSRRRAKPDKAVGALSEAVRLQPHSGQAGRLLAQAFMDAGRAGEGLEQFLQSVESDPTNPGAYYDLGKACLRHALAIADKIMAETKTSPHSRRIFAEN